MLSKILGFRSDVLAVIFFGSCIYRGFGRDLDIIVVVKDYRVDSFRDSRQLRMYLDKSLEYRVLTDVHVLSEKDFIGNLVPGTFLSGLALGYRIVYSRIDYLEEKILEMLEELAKTDYTLINRYGEWRLEHHAKIRLKQIKRKHLSKTN